MSERATRLPITLCMLTRNEEDRVAASLGAVRAHVERMVVVDAESDDRTREAAEAAGAVVVVRPWEGFVPARRYLMSLATTPWILMIDADEVVRPQLWEELEKRGFPEDRIDGYQLRRRTVYADTRLRRSFQPDWKTTLARTEAAYFEDRSVHEALQVRGKIVRLSAEILHHSYRSAADHYARIHTYARLAAEDLARRGKRPGAVDLDLRPGVGSPRSSSSAGSSTAASA